MEQQSRDAAPFFSWISAVSYQYLCGCDMFFRPALKHHSQQICQFKQRHSSGDLST